MSDTKQKIPGDASNLVGEISNAPDEDELRRIEQEQLEQERLEQERLEQERLEQERLEQERLEQERLQAEQLEREEQERKEEEERLREQNKEEDFPDDFDNTKKKDQNQAKKYLKMKQEKDKEEKKKMLLLLKKEEMELETKCKKLLPEANKLCSRYCKGRQYEIKEPNPNYVDEEFQVIVKENGKIVRAVNSRHFMREYEKLANLQLRDQYRPKAAGSSGKGPGDQKKTNRRDVQEELRALLKNTTELTKQLENQLNELKRRGWNVPQE